MGTPSFLGGMTASISLTGSKGPYALSELLVTTQKPPGTYLTALGFCWGLGWTRVGHIYTILTRKRLLWKCELRDYQFSSTSSIPSYNVIRHLHPQNADRQEGAKFRICSKIQVAVTHVRHWRTRRPMIRSITCEPSIPVAHAVDLENQALIFRFHSILEKF